MPPKRSVAGTPASSPKKPKLSSPQKSLHAFFGRASEKASSSSHSSPSKSAPVEDGDARVALELAREDGVDVEVTRKLEKSWRPNSRRRPSIEVIDVDALELEESPNPSVFPALRPSTPPSILPSPEKLTRFAIEKPVSKSVSGGYALLTCLKHETSSMINDISAYPALSEDPLTFPTDRCPWVSGAPAPYAFLAHTLSSLSETRSRIAILNILTNALRLICLHHSASLLPSLYLLSNSLSPPYISVELGLGPSIITKAIQHVSGLSSATLRRLYNTKGDAGDVAFEAKSNVRTLVPHPPLMITGVFQAFLKIANSKGEGATKQKQAIVEKLLVAAKGEEARYLVRTLSQHIRVGAVRTSILTALARALVLTRTMDADIFPSPDSPYFACADLLAQVKKLDGDTKKKVKEEDAARAEVLLKFAEAESLLKRIFVQHPNYDDIVTALLAVGLEGLSQRVYLSVGVPLHPTLGSPTRSLDEIYDRLGDLPFVAEFKYDGQRAQIHAVVDPNGDVTVKIFSRHLEDMTDKYPDIVFLVESLFRIGTTLTSFIIDAEIVAIDPSDGSLKSFQELSNRARKDVQLHEVKVAVCVFVFDLMYHNGEVLLAETCRVRRERLHKNFPPVVPETKGAARLAHVECCESETGREAVELFWQRAIDGRSEGLMVKLLDSGEVLEEPDNVKGRPKRKPLPASYEPDKRTSAWLKLKKDYVNGVGDSLDLVPIGAWHGNGRKAQWWSPILLALWDPSVGQLVAVCKCMSGFTDEFYKALGDRYPEGSSTCSRSPLWGGNTGGLKPEVYFEPREVWEIRGADITLSPVSVAALGLVSQSRGLSLRFPRFIRTREDKGITEASTAEFLSSIWKKQDGRGVIQGGVDEGELIDASPLESEIEDNDEDGFES